MNRRALFGLLRNIALYFNIATFALAALVLQFNLQQKVPRY
ncbi:hypothetical protein MKY87_07340 [Paenibacillus sp. FSL R7-0198]